MHEAQTTIERRLNAVARTRHTPAARLFRRSASSQPVNRLLERYRESGDAEALESLLAENEGLIVNLAKQHSALASNWRTSKLDLEDLISEAVLVVIDALRLYQAERPAASGGNVKLSTYLYHKIHHGLITACDRSSAVRCVDKKRGIRSYHQKVYDRTPEKKREFERKQGWIQPDGTLDEDAVNKSYIEHIALVEVAHPLSTSKSYVEVGSFKDELLDPRSVSETDRSDFKLEVQNALSGLSARQQEVARFTSEGYNAPEIAEMLGCSVSSVRHDKERIAKALASFELK